MGPCTSAASKASATTGTAPRASATTPAPTCKDDTHGSLTCAADRPDLYHWRPAGLAVGHRTHGGPNVFELGGHYWMFVDEWRGQGVLRSDDLASWELRGLILDKPGRRPDDGAIGLHADVVVQGGTAYVFCFPTRGASALSPTTTAPVRLAVPPSRPPPHGSSTAPCCATATSLYGSICLVPEL